MVGFALSGSPIPRSEGALIEERDDMQNRGNPIPQFDVSYLYRIDDTRRLTAQSQEFIMCYGMPVADQPGWPIARPRTNYVSNQQLCPSISTVHENVGCRCYQPFTRVTCVEEDADPVLWAAQLDPILSRGVTNFNDWCRNQCWCGMQRVAQQYQRYPPQTQANSQPDLTQRFLYADGQASGNAASSSGFLSIPLGGSNPFGYTFNTTLPSAAVSACGDVQCELQSACHGTNCQCKVSGARYEPSAGMIEYIAFCASSTPGQISPRHEDIPCPCNRYVFSSRQSLMHSVKACTKHGISSYVSHACCSKENNGWVWEAPELKLGELVKGEL